MLLAADVGGTHTRFGLFERDGARPRALDARSYRTATFGGFDQAISTFLRDAKVQTVEAVGIGVAGPVVRQRATLTNVPWALSAEGVSQQVGGSRVRLLNDLEAMGHAVDVLQADELETMQAGEPNPEGNAALIAPGTGLGEAFLPRLDGRWRILATEAGHADFAARTDRELELVRFLRATDGRASNEHVLCGMGLRHLHRFAHQRAACVVVTNLDAVEGPAQVTATALAGRCPGCVEALDMFVEALGAECSNLALRGTATAGVYIGGGIARQILAALRAPRFLEAFRDKAPMRALVERMPVHVILHKDTGLLGAAVAASRLG